MAPKIKSELSSRYERVCEHNKGYFFLFLFKPSVVTPHLNLLIDTVQMRDHNMFLSHRDGSEEGSQPMCLYAELTKITPNYHQILLLI